jgi:hypothetical protein
VIANSLRLVRFGEDVMDAEELRRQTEASRPMKPTRQAELQRASTRG